MLRHYKNANVLLRPLLVLAIVGSTAGIKYWGERYWGEGPSLIFFIPSVVLAAYLGGAWAGSLATFLSGWIAICFFFFPRFSWQVVESDNVARLFIFVGCGAMISILFERLHSSEFRLREANQNLDMALRQLKSREQMLEYFVEHTPAAVAIFDTEMRYLFVSKRFFHDYSITAPKEDVLGHTHYEVFPDIPEHWKELHRQTLRGEIRSNEADPWLRHDGKTTWVRWQTHPWYDELGNIGGIFIFSENITERKKAELALKKAHDELAEANVDLERFTSVASHDLQEPLRTISSYLQLLEMKYGEKLTDEAIAYLHYAKASARQLQLMIRDLLSFASSTTGSLKFEQVDTDAALSQIVRRLETSIGASKATICHETLPLLLTNRTLLEQILQNLLTNALKYRGANAPQIQVSATHASTEWIFTVKDNGEGIPDEAKERIFDLLYRVHGSDVLGSGIGLAICRRILRRLGGRIWVTSVVGHGSEFHFSIPDRDHLVSAHEATR